MKAIVTTFHGPTNTKGSRVSAQDMDGNRITISWSHVLNGEAAHAEAALALCKKLDWHGRLVAGAIVRGYVFVFEMETSTYDAEGKPA
jgi:hypothetical protein